MSTNAGQQAKLDAYADVSPEPDPEPSGKGGPTQRADSAPDGRASELAAIFENVTGDATFVEEQRETPSHDPVEGEFDVDLTDDGLDDAADSDLVMGGWI